MLLLHIEFQNQEDPSFESRVYFYNAKIGQTYGEKPVSLAILGDLNPKWRPNGFEHSFWEHKLRFRFPAVKLLDFKGREPELEASSSLFAFVVLVHLASMEFKSQPAKPLERKIALTKNILKKGFTSKELRHLRLFIEALMPLSGQGKKEFEMQMGKFKNKQRIDLRTPEEKAAIARERQKAVKKAVKEATNETAIKSRLEILTQQLRIRFGELTPEQEQIIAHADSSQLDLWLKNIFSAQSADELLSI